MRDDLIERYRAFTDERMLEMYGDRDDFEPEAVEAMEAVLAERGLRVPEPAAEPPPTVGARVTIWEELVPELRSARYEDALVALLDEGDRGRVTGGGTQLTSDGRIESVDIELEIEDDDELIEAILVTLTECGAPSYSTLTLDDGDEATELTFGVAEGVSFVLRVLPSEAETTMLIEQLTDAIGPDLLSDFRGGYEGRGGEFAFFVYGHDAEELWAKMEPVVAASPLCRGATIVVRCGHPAGKPRELTMPG